MGCNVIYDLREDQWERVKDSLPGKAGDRGRSGCDNRGFIRAVMCIARKGAPWRALPKEPGNWASVHKRFMRWGQSWSLANDIQYISDKC
jgi:transposase